MRQELFERLRCPGCQGRLGLQVEQGTPSHVEEGWLDCWQCVERYPIVASIPRFVPVANYADNFGMLWAAFKSVALDSAAGITQARDRFIRDTGWQPDELRGKWVLEVGCGSGRFTEIAQQFGAYVVAVDYSTAIDVCRKNLGEEGRVHYIQGDIYGLPFRPGQFDFVCCFGVLHRLPDARTALLQLPKQLRPGGKLVVDIAAPKWFRSHGPVAWLRMLTTRMPPSQAMKFASHLAAGLLPIQRALGAIPFIGKWLQSLFPIASVETLEACTAEAAQARACLAMCDRLTTVHHRPARVATLAEWLRDSGLDEPEVTATPTSTVVGRALVPPPFRPDSQVA